MTITALLASATPAEAIERLVEIRKKHWIESYRGDADAFQATPDYLDTGIEVLMAYRQVLAFELGFGPGTDAERQESYRAWADAAKSPAKLAHRLANRLMAQIDQAFHEQLSGQYEFVPKHITMGDTEWHWWMEAMREAGMHAGQFVEKDASGATVRAYVDSDSGASAEVEFPIEEAAQVGEAFQKLCRAAGKTSDAFQAFGSAAEDAGGLGSDDGDSDEQDKVALIVAEVRAHAAEHDYIVDSRDMALTGIDESMSRLGIQLTPDEVEAAIVRLIFWED